MSRPIWGIPPPIDTRVLHVDRTVDVCVVGAGVAGLTTAYLLAREGRSVLVLEDGPIGGGETSRTTAQLVTAIDRGWSAILRAHGLARASLAAESHRTAIDRIESIVREERLEARFARLDGYLLGDRDRTRLHAEHAAVQAVGLADVQWVDEAPFGGGAALRFPDQAQLDPLRYVAGLARAFEKRGGRIVAGARAETIEDVDPVVVRTVAGAEVRARAVVIATNAPFVTNLEASLKQYAHRTYVVAGPVPAGSVQPGLYWDLEEPFHYVRLLDREGAGRDVLLVGGEDHRTGQDDRSAAERYERLAEWARERVPGFGEVTASWSGQVLETMDGLALIGRLRPGVHVITGDSGNGMTHATIGGILLTDLIHGRTNPWADVYDPGRIRVRAGFEFVRQNVNTAVQLLDHVTPGDLEGVEQLLPGTGAVLRHGLTKIAAYRDHEGQVHSRSAVCPHLGCLVRWNDEESSWDCPCHGSRFDALGHLLNGPANEDLAPHAAEAPPSGSRDAPEAPFAFRGVLLDVDGTLLDSNDAHARAWAEALAGFGQRVSPGALRSMIGMGADKLLPKIAGIPADSALGRDVAQRRGEIFRQRYLPHLQPFPGARGLLLELRARDQKLVVASSADGQDLDGLLERADAADLVDATTSSDDAERSKPDPDIVEAAIDRAGLPASALVMIGDTPYDVEAGSRAGVPVIALRCGGWNTTDLAGATLVHDHPAALLLALRRPPLSGWFAGPAARTPAGSG